MIPGTRYAFQVFHPTAPVLRVRYRRGVLVGPHGFPDWVPYARAVVALPPLPAGLTVDEGRVAGVLAANLAMAGSLDPLWRGPDDHATPAGWTWAFLAMTRQVALVPVELHGAFRHLGGVSTTPATKPGRGVTVEPGDGSPPRVEFDERLAEDAVVKLEEHLGCPLPDAYRDFLARTNGGRPAAAAVHPRHGFLVDQPFFGLARKDRSQDLAYVSGWLRDRLTPHWLAVGYVQGGLLAVKVRGDDKGSVWYLDDDDPRDRDEYTAAEICDQLLHRCADDFASFWTSLRTVPGWLLDIAAGWVTTGAATPLTPDGMGADLPVARGREGR